MNLTKPTPSDIEKLLMTCGRWNISGNMFVAFENISQGVDHVHHIPKESLALLHPHLPAVAEHLNKDNNLKLDGKCYMAALVITLEHWAVRLPEVTDDSGDKHVLADVVSIKEKDGAIALKGLHVRLGEFMQESSLETISFVVKTLGMHTIFVTPEELEKRFPGWVKRLEVAEALELTGRTRMQCLFSPPRTPTQGSLPDFIVE